MYYFSASTVGFYLAAIHGSRTTQQPDPAWTRPRITVTLQPGEHYFDGETTITNAEPHARELHDLPDWTAQQPNHEVPNPDCLIPADAVEISVEEHARLMAGQASGSIIVSDAEGYPMLADPPPPTPEQIRASAVAEIDSRREDGLVAGVSMGGSNFHSDDRFLVELLGMVMGYQTGVFNGTQSIRTRDNEIVQLNVQAITELAAIVGAHRKAVYATSWAEKDAL